MYLSFMVNCQIVLKILDALIRTNDSRKLCKLIKCWIVLAITYKLI